MRIKAALYSGLPCHRRYTFRSSHRRM
jgi:hypothetical protein